MEFKKSLELTSRCLDKFNQFYNDHNFSMVTHKGNTIGFNLRQSKLASFIGISDSFLSVMDKERDKDLKALVNLVKNKNYYLELFNEGKTSYLEIFSEDAPDRLLSFLNLKDMNGRNTLFLVFPKYDDEYDCYLFVNDSLTYRGGHYLAFKKEGQFYSPKKIISIKDEDVFFDILNSGCIEIVSSFHIWDKIKNINSNSAKEGYTIKKIADMLVSYGKSEFNYSDKDIQDILFRSQHNFTKWISSSEYGYDTLGKIKTNYNGLQVLDSQLEELRRLRGLITQYKDENERLQEIVCNVLDELYTEKNSPKGLGRIFKRK